MQIAIVGTGLIGKVCALALRQHGYTADCIGREFTPSPFDARCYALTASTCDLLRATGVWQALDHSVCSPVSAMQLYQADGQALLNFSAYQSNLEQMALIVPQAALERATSAVLAAQLPATTQHDLTLTQLHQLPAGIQLHSAAQQLGPYDALIACDGAQSWVRQQSGIATHYKDYQLTALSLAFTAAHDHLQVAHQWFTPDGVIALLPLSTQRYSLVWSMPNRLRAQWQAASASAIAAYLNQLIDSTNAQRPRGATQVLIPRLQAIEQASADLVALDASWHPLHFRYAQQLYQRGIFLVGDAAHTIHPFAGLGANLGFADIVALIAQLPAKGPAHTTGRMSSTNKAANATLDPARIETWGVAYARTRQLPLALRLWGLDALLQTLPTGIQSIWPAAPTQAISAWGMRLLDRYPPAKRWLAELANQ